MYPTRVGEDEYRTSDLSPHERRYTVPEAATVLGISPEAVRSRISRGTLDIVREEGRVYVLLPDQPVTDRTHDLSPVVEALQDEVRYLREELARRDEAYREESRRKDHLLAAALERIPPQLEPPREERESPTEPAEPSGRAETPQETGRGPDQRSWWRRWFGG